MSRGKFKDLRRGMERDLVLAFTNGVQKIMDYWPGIYEETSSKLGDGGSQDSRLS